MKIGLVTILYKSDEMLPDFFHSISIQEEKNYILIIIDNSPNKSTRITIQQLNAKYNLPLVHLEMSSNIGVAAANNRGIEEAFRIGCEDIIFLNNDIVFNDKKLFSGLNQLSNKYYIIAPKIYYYNSKLIWYGGGLLRRWFGFVKHLGSNKTDETFFSNACPTEYAPTCFVYVKKKVIEEIGLIDEKYFVYVDDTDFMYRAALRGFYIWYTPDFSLYHKVSQSTGGLYSDFSLYYDTRNKIYFSKKFNKLFYQITSNFFVISFAIFFAIKSKRKSAYRSVIKAIRDGFAMRVQ